MTKHRKYGLDLRPYNRYEHSKFCHIPLVELIAQKKAARTPEQDALARKGMSWGIAAGWIKQA